MQLSHTTSYIVLTCNHEYICLLNLRYVFLPKSKASITWEVIMSILSLVSCLAVSLQASFFISSGYLWAANYTIDVLFAIDM